jgi:hypothetical protein
MPVELGDTTGEDYSITVEAGSALTAGDAVAIDQGATEGRFPVVVPLQDDTTPDTDQEAGVITTDVDSGDTGEAVLDGPVIANVAADINQGERLGASATAGQLASEDDGPILALSGEGGTARDGTSLGANEAEVFL